MTDFERLQMLAAGRSIGMIGVIAGTAMNSWRFVLIIGVIYLIALIRGGLKMKKLL